MVPHTMNIFPFFWIEIENKRWSKKKKVVKKSNFLWRQMDAWIHQNDEKGFFCFYPRILVLTSIFTRHLNILWTHYHFTFISNVKKMVLGGLWAHIIPLTNEIWTFVSHADTIRKEKKSKFITWPHQMLSISIANIYCNSWWFPFMHSCLYFGSIGVAFIWIHTACQM